MSFSTRIEQAVQKGHIIDQLIEESPKKEESSSSTSAKVEGVAIDTIADPLQIPCAPGVSDKRIAKLMYLERRCGGGTQDYSPFSSFSQVPEAFRPGSGTESFSVPGYSVPQDKTRVILANPSENVKKMYLREDGTVRFCVHPAIDGQDWVPFMDQLLKYEKEAPLAVNPTSSTRTVLVLDQNAPLHSLKLHCPLKISRFVRNVGPRTVEHCVTVSKDLEKVVCPHFALLRESMGVCFSGENEEAGWGFIVREMTPFPPTEKKTMLIPCFALYGKDTLHPERDPLLVQMIKQSNEDPMEYALNHVFYPIIDCFVSTFQQRGILLEAHGQNALLEVDENMKPTGRIAHRDLDDEVDPEVRQKLGLSLEGFHPLQLIPPVSEEDPKGCTHSIIYDKSIGKLHFNYVAKLLEERFGVPKEALQKKCQEYFKGIFPDFADYFPKTVFKYSDKEKPGLPNYFSPVDTKETPLWRPVV